MRAATRLALRDFGIGVALGVALVLLTLALAGCATAPPDLTTGVQTVTVDRPVVVPCVNAADIPPEPATAMPDPKSGIKQLAAGASADARALTAYAQQLRAALVACEQPVQPAGGKP